MIIHPAEPNSLEWLAARAGIPTASELDQLLTPLFKIRTGQMPQSYIARKVAEAWLRSPIAGFQSIDMEIGSVLEKEALPFYELLHGVKVQRVGLVLTDDKRFGASPDGLLVSECGLECKCPRADTHVRYLLENKVPDDYLAQVHGGMYATGYSRWVFMSYHRRMPPLILIVERDPEIQDSIAAALAAFNLSFDLCMATLEKVNGGPPRRSSAAKETKQEFTTTEDVPH